MAKSLDMVTVTFERELKPEEFGEIEAMLDNAAGEYIKRRLKTQPGFSAALSEQTIKALKEKYGNRVFIEKSTYTVMGGSCDGS